MAQPDEVEPGGGTLRLRRGPTGGEVYLPELPTDYGRRVP